MTNKKREVVVKFANNSKPIDFSNVAFALAKKIMEVGIESERGTEVSRVVEGNRQDDKGQE